jgi:hypothetical protein
MKTWNYQGNPVNQLTDLPNSDNLIGFVYKITNLKTGAIYIGKKSVQSHRKKTLTKAELALITDKRLKKYKIVTKESDWKKYWGSNKQLQEDIKSYGDTFFNREILELAYSKKYLTYLELKYQFTLDVLGRNSYNGNILGRFYPKDLQQIDMDVAE